MRPEIKVQPLKDFLQKYDLTINKFENFIMNGQTIEELILEEGK